MALTTNKKNIFYAMLLMYALFSFITPLSSMLFIVPTLIIFSSVILFDDSDVLCLLAFGACFGNCGWKISQFLTTIDIVIGLLIIKQFIIALKTKNKRNIIFISIMVSIVMIVTMYGLIITHFHFYKYAQGLGILLAVTEVGLLGKINLKKLSLVLSFGIIASAILSIIASNCGILVQEPYSLVSSTTVRFGAYFLNVNALALYCSICQACLLTLILTREFHIKNWFWLPLIITGIGFMSFSKTFALITVVTYFMFAIIGFAISKHKKNYIIWSAITLIVLAVVLVVCWDYVEILIGRFGLDKQTSNKLNTITTGRVNIWTVYINKWKSSPLYILFGCGITADNLVNRTTHSLLISLLYKFGIIGTIALIGALIFMFRGRFKGKNIIYWLPLIVILTNGISEDIACSLYTCLPILISLTFALNAKNKQK